MTPYTGLKIAVNFYFGSLAMTFTYLKLYIAITINMYLLSIYTSKITKQTF